MKRPKQLVNEIIAGKKRITAETALDLERALDVPSHVLVRLQADYDLVKARLTQSQGGKLAREATGGLSR